MKKHRNLLLTILLVMGLAGCATMSPVDKSSATQSSFVGIQPGDTVQVEKHNGEIVLLNVAAVDANSISSDQVKISASEVKSISRQEFSFENTAKLAGASTLIYVAVVSSILLSL